MFAAAIIAFISGISATYFSVFRISYALAEQKIMPKIYHKRFWEHGTYGNALSVAVLTLATIYFDFNSIVNLASGAYLVSYLAVFAASWVLRRETGASPVLILLGSALMVFILVMFLANIYCPSCSSRSESSSHSSSYSPNAAEIHASSFWLRIISSEVSGV